VRWLPRKIPQIGDVTLRDAHAYVDRIFELCLPKLEQTGRTNFLIEQAPKGVASFNNTYFEIDLLDRRRDLYGLWMRCGSSNHIAEISLAKDLGIPRALVSVEVSIFSGSTPMGGLLGFNIDQILGALKEVFGECNLNSADHYLQGLAKRQAASQLIHSKIWDDFEFHMEVDGGADIEKRIHEGETIYNHRLDGTAISWSRSRRYPGFLFGRVKYDFPDLLKLQAFREIETAPVDTQRELTLVFRRAQPNRKGQENRNNYFYEESDMQRMVGLAKRIIEKVPRELGQWESRSSPPFFI